ncbi:hypothetical protein LLF88_01945 [bacterium]|nr:hypothetical protein [bacterium]
MRAPTLHITAEQANLSRWRVGASLSHSTPLLMSVAIAGYGTPLLARAADADVRARKLIETEFDRLGTWMGTRTDKVTWSD